VYNVILLLPKIPSYVPQFFISSAVQQRLDCWLQIWAQYWACSCHHCNATQPSNMPSHSISCWSDKADCVLSYGAGTIDLYHPWRPCTMSSSIPGAVSCSSIHLANSMSIAFHIVFADMLGHHFIHNLSLRGS